MTSSLAALLMLLSATACSVLVAGEANRPPPPEIAAHVPAAIETPFVHRWSRDTSHPFLAAAAIDIDGDGRNDVRGANMDGHARAYLNRTEGRFLAVRLPDAPVSIGARLRLEGVQAPVRQVIAGEGLTSDRTAQHMFGLARDSPAPTALVVEWLDSEVTRVANPRLNERLVINAP